jgi:uncharacterized protein
VLLALGWAEHEAHGAVVARLSRRPQPRWFTCPITELGFVRISATTGVFSRTLTPAQAQGVLAGLCEDAKHGFVGEHPSVRACDFSSLSGPRQTTDAYLLALAAQHGLHLLTLDGRMANALGTERIELLA